MLRIYLGFFLVIIATSGCVGWCLHWLATPLPLTESGLLIELKPGDSLGRVAYRLHARGVLQHPRILLAYARLMGDINVRVGEYTFTQSTSPLALLEKLINGDVLSYPITLVEGWTYAQALEALHQQPKLTATLADKTIEEQMAVMNIEVIHPEGWFFPDTYQFTAGMTDVDVLKQAHRRMRHILAQAWEERSLNLPYENAYQALIMASIVERETGQPSERQQIAGVFVRRLQHNMRLQTDPTVIYGLGKSFDGNIRRRHLKQATPYNTYTIKGLPPTPIALPGKEAIYAALHPDDSEALYFVAKGDGSHAFSSTIEAHNKAVRHYQIVKRSKDYRSTPVESSTE